MNPAEDYILSANEPYRSIMLHLQLAIENTLPNAVMLYKYKIPFYYLDGTQPFCYINQTKNYVDVGFWHGAHLTKHPGFLISESRKHMKSLRYFSLEELNDIILIDILKEAYSVRNRKYYK